MHSFPACNSMASSSSSSSSIDKNKSPASQFITLWQSGKCDTEAHETLQEILSYCPLSGRMTHGKTGVQGFGELLSSDRWKRLSWVFGPEALSSFLGKSARDICLILGFGEEWLDAKLEKGVEFKLAIFPSSAAEVRQATWDGVAYLLQTQYGEIWNEGPKISKHWDYITTTSFDEIQQLAGYNMLRVNLVGRDHNTGESADHRYMSLQRLGAYITLLITH